MVLLAFQSTGSEADDLKKIETRLSANKKVIVTMNGCEEFVRHELAKLFGTSAVGEMKRVSKNTVTLAEEWQCALHRKLSKNTNHTREREREEKRKRIMQVERMEPLTAEGFANKLKVLAAPITLDTFDHEKISRIMASAWSEKFERMKQGEGRHDHIRGLVAEKVVPIMLRSELVDLCSTVETMYASDLAGNLKDNAFRVEEGGDPDQVEFMQVYSTERVQSYMEFDALLRTATLQEYIALDVTTNIKKKRHYEERQEKLETLSRVLGAELMLIDICLTNRNFSYVKKTPNIYRWDLPCALNFHELIGKIVPATLEQRLWGQTIGRRG